MSTLRSLIHQNFPPSCFSADDLDDVYSVLSDTDFLFPTISASSPVQERLASYYTVGGVLAALPSPVAKRTEHAMRWSESTRLPQKTREARDKFDQLIDLCQLTSSTKEELLLDILPLWRMIDKNLSSKVRRNLQQLCDFPLRGKMIIDEPESDVEQVPLQTQTGGWLIEDDIED
jgi:hypothetical protein